MPSLHREPTDSLIMCTMGLLVLSIHRESTNFLIYRYIKLCRHEVHVQVCSLSYSIPTYYTLVHRPEIFNLLLGRSRLINSIDMPTRNTIGI